MFRSWRRKSAIHGMGLPRLRLPKSAAGRHPDARVRPREFKAWLISIDDRNPLQTCKALLNQLRLLARFPRTIPKLPELLKLMELSISDLELHAGELIEGRQSEATQRATDQFLPVFDSLLTELGHLQKRMVNDLLDSSNGLPPAVLVSAMRTLVWQLRIDLTRYENAQLEIWQDMFQLYQVTEFADATGVLVSSNGDSEQNVHNLFFGALLFLLCDPLRFPPRFTWRLFAHAVELAPLLEFETAKQKPRGIPIDPTGKTLPLIYARKPRSSTCKPPQYLQVDRLTKALKAEQDQFSGMLVRTIYGLSVNRTMQSRRREDRHAQQAEFRMFVGLTNIHQRLSQFAPPSTSDSNDADFDPASVVVDQSTPRYLTCHLFDQSQRGAGFVLNSGTARGVTAGDLVLMETQSTRDASRSVGFVARVRRLLLREDGLLEIGVEKLAGRLKPVRFAESKHAQYGLLQQDRDKDEFHLIVAKSGVTAETIFSLTDASGEWQIQAQATAAQPEAYWPIPVKLIT